MFPLELIAPNTEIPLAIGLPPFTTRLEEIEPEWAIKLPLIFISLLGNINDIHVAPPLSEKSISSSILKKRSLLELIVRTPDWSVITSLFSKNILWAERFPLELIAPNTERPSAIGLPPFIITPPENEPVSDRIEPVNEPVNEPVFTSPAFRAKDAVIA